MKNLKILFIRFSSIGDIILTTPLLRAFKTKYPQSETHYLIKPKFSEIIANNPYVDKMISLENESLGGLISLSRSLRRENYNYVIDLHKNFRSFIVKFILGKKSSSFNKLNIEKYLLVNLRINRLPKVHIVDRYFRALRPLKVVNDNKGLNFFIPEDIVTRIQKNISAEFGNEIPIAVSLSGNYFTKKWLPEYFIEFINKLNRPVILLGGKNETTDAEKILKQIHVKHINAVGKTNLYETGVYIKLSSFFITHDTGTMHIGAALKKKIFSIWGNTIPEFGMYPYMTEHYILENKNLSCRPCTKLGFDECPKEHFKCMREITPEIVLQTVLQSEKM